MEKTLFWYGSRARDIARYMSEEPPNTIAVMAVLEELRLDAGNRAKSAEEEEPFAWLWECEIGPYAGEIDVYSVNAPAEEKEAARVRGLYGEPFPVYRK